MCAEVHYLFVHNMDRDCPMRGNLLLYFWNLVKQRVEITPDRFLLQAISITMTTALRVSNHQLDLRHLDILVILAKLVSKCHRGQVCEVAQMKIPRPEMCTSF